jgi:S-layer family protein
MTTGTGFRGVGVALVALLTFGLVAPASAAAPVNDDFADALPISEGIELRFDNREATTEAGEVVCDDGPTGYWEFTAPTAGDYVSYATGSNVDTEIGWSASLTSKTGDCPDDADDSYDAVETAMTLASGEKEYVQLGFNSANERGTSGVGVARVFPGDDAFADRSSLTFRPGAPTAVRGVSFVGTEGVQGSEPAACGSSPLDQTVWLKFTAPTTEAWYLEAKFPSQVNIGVYSGDSLSGLSQLGCSTGGRNAVVVELTAGTTYAVQIDNVVGGPETGVVRAEAAGRIRSLPTVVDLDGDGTSTNVGTTSAVALLADNRPAIAYVDSTNAELRFAERSAGGTWSDVLIDADGDGTSTSVGFEADVAILDDGRPAVAYLDGSNAELRYAERSAGGTWSDVLIDADGDGTSTSVGSELSLLTLTSGRPAVAYYDLTNGELRYAERSAGGTWSDVLIDADGDGTSTDVGEGVDMILYNGEPVIAYADDTNDQQRLAVRSGSGWSDSLILGTSPLTDGEIYDGANGQPSLAVGPDAKLHIVIQGDDTGFTTYGTMSSGGTWTFEDILTDRLLAELGWDSSVELNFDRAGNPVVIWADGNDAGHIGASVRSGGSWSEQVTTPYLLDPRDLSSDGSVEMFNTQMDSLVFPDGRLGFAAHDSVNGGLYWVEDSYRVCPTAATPFTDVSATSFAKDDIPCIFGLDVTTGTSATTYAPSNQVTREQMAAFLARLYREMTGEPCSGGTTPFTDVSATSFAKDDIPCIFGLGITTGTTATTYSPDDFVTREQMAAFLARLYRKVTDPTCSGGTTPFTDVSATSFAKDDIPCIFGLGITTGTTATTYSPDDFVTREQMAAFLGRLWRTPAVLP